MRVLLFIVAALMAAGGTGFYLFQQMTRQPVEVAQVPEPVTTTSVYVPRFDLPAGTLIGREMLAELELENETVSPEMIVPDGDGDAEILGSVARQSLAKGVPIARSTLVQPGERGFLAAVLPKGKRAISFEISETAGLFGLMQPGDRVDMILTYSFQTEGTSGRSVHASETVMKNLRVLALDQRLHSGGSYLDEEGNPIERPVARIATLEVTPAQAEKVTLAASLGSLSLVLNSVQDGGEPEVAEVDGGFDGLLGPIMRQNPGDGVTMDARLSQSQPGPPERNEAGLTMDTDVTTLLPRGGAIEVQIVRGAK
ncbi:Flp pilus assembly protein CpaB [Amaricoccus tamworthensis]|uniref:Flp pilus assembly protein CpaB n=1 Tax=Amaricoccus tamworthensis TaxID=57002 RepID=UPI003C79F465